MKKPTLQQPTTGELLKLFGPAKTIKEKGGQYRHSFVPTPIKEIQETLSKYTMSYGGDQ